MPEHTHHHRLAPSILTAAVTAPLAAAWAYTTLAATRALYTLAGWTGPAGTNALADSLGIPADSVVFALAPDAIGLSLPVQPVSLWTATGDGLVWAASLLGPLFVVALGCAAIGRVVFRRAQAVMTE